MVWYPFPRAALNGTPLHWIAGRDGAPSAGRAEDFVLKGSFFLFWRQRCPLLSPWIAIPGYPGGQVASCVCDRADPDAWRNLIKSHWALRNAHIRQKPPNHLDGIENVLMKKEMPSSGSILGGSLLGQCSIEISPSIEPAYLSFANSPPTIKFRFCSFRFVELWGNCLAERTIFLNQNAI